MQGVRVQGVHAQGMHTQGVRTQGMRMWGCMRRGGGDTQPIRIQVGTLSQSDYRCAQGVCAQGMYVQGACAQGVCMQGMCMQGVRAQGWWGHSANQITGGDTQPIRLQVHAGGVHTGGVHAEDACAGGVCTGGVHAGDVRTGDVRAGGARAGVVGTLSQSDYRWGHSANQITGACRGCVCRGCACRGCSCRGCSCRGGGDTQPIRLQVGTLSKSDYRCTQGVRTQGVCAQGMHVQGMCAQGVRAQGWWGHSANQITGGDTQPIRLQVRVGGAHAGVVGTLSQSDYTGLRARMRVQGLCVGGVHTGDACKGVVGTLSQSDYTGLCLQGVHAQGWWGHLANQITQGCAHRGCVRRGCTHRGGGDT